MHPTRLAHNAHFLTSVAIWAALGVATAFQTGDSGTLVLDLTKPVPTEEQRIGVPGASIGGVGGQPLPRGYPLPLAVELRSISPQPVRPGDKFTVEVLLRNIGDSPFCLPASQNVASVLKQGNKGRRSFDFSLMFEDPKSGKQTSHVMASASRSNTVPNSCLRVDPGQTVRVLFRGDSYPLWEWVKPGTQRVRVRAQVSEWKYEDKRYFIENEAEPVVSANAITFELAPAN